MAQSLPPYLPTLSLLLSSLSLPSPLPSPSSLTPTLLLSILSQILQIPLTLNTLPSSPPNASSTSSKSALAQLKLALGVLETSTRIDYSSLNPLAIVMGQDPEGLEMIGRGVILLAMLQGWVGTGRREWKSTPSEDRRGLDQGEERRRDRRDRKSREKVNDDPYKFATPPPTRKNLPLPIAPQQASSESPSPSPSQSQYFEYGFHSSFRSSTPKPSPRIRQASNPPSSQSSHVQPDPFAPKHQPPNSSQQRAPSSSSTYLTSSSPALASFDSLHLSTPPSATALITKHNAPSAYAQLRADAEAQLEEELIRFS